MAISFIANALGATNSTTSFSITLPTTAANDILICEFAHRGTGNGTIGGTSVTTGGLTWTLKHSQLFASSAFSGKTYWTRATGDHAGQTVTGSSLTNSCAAILTQYRGALASGDPLADATIVGEENASANETQAQITTATDGAYVVLVVVNSPDLAVTSQACTSPGSLTARAERLSTGGTDSSIAHASAAKATAGGTGAFTWTQSDAASGSWAYAITPAGAVTTPVSISATATGVAALSRAATYGRTLAATATGAPTLGLATVFGKALAATVTGAATLTTALVASVSIPATAVGAAVLSRVATYSRALSAAATGSATLTKGLFVSLAAGAVGAAGLTKGMFQTLAATVVGVPAVVTALMAGVTMAATAVGVAGLTRAMIYARTLTAVAVGVVSLTATFISGAEQTVASIVTFFRHRFRR